MNVTRPVHVVAPGPEMTVVQQIIRAPLAKVTVTMITNALEIWFVEMTAATHFLDSRKVPHISITHCRLPIICIPE